MFKTASPWSVLCGDIVYIRKLTHNVPKSCDLRCHRNGSITKRESAERVRSYEQGNDLHPLSKVSDSLGGDPVQVIATRCVSCGHNRPDAMSVFCARLG